ncbi:MAG: DUF72 domain-containing protein [Leptolyngbyaceae cyanobacterium MO_188.B28]|nr:DUF72 domain-containing protein [Leptolyngbyaceae cyanobacterium MO_188.B28]
MTSRQFHPFFIGCAVWAYKDWAGDLFPAGSRPKDFLNLYSRRLTAVEGNATFYSIPDASTVSRWAEETPEGFKFCLKLPRTITHQGPLCPHLTAALEFLDLMQPLGNRLGPLFAQLPPSYSPAFLDDLRTFLTSWPRKSTPIAVEVRHPNWFTEPHSTQLNTLLENLGVGRVLLDTRPIYDAQAAGAGDPQILSERRKPKLPLYPVVTAPFSLIRYISHPELALNSSYLAEWVSLVSRWLKQETQIYFFVHCPVEAKSPTIARHFQQMLEKEDPVTPPLPWEKLTKPPEQLSLF